MPAAIIKGRLHTRCETCGAENAAFGFGVNLRRALEALAAGRIDAAKRLLGRWFCGECRKEME